MAIFFVNFNMESFEKLFKCTMRKIYIDGFIEYVIKNNIYKYYLVSGVGQHYF